MTGKCWCRSGLPVMGWRTVPESRVYRPAAFNWVTIVGLSATHSHVGPSATDMQMWVKCSNVDPWCQGNREETTVPPMQRRRDRVRCEA